MGQGRAPNERRWRGAITRRRVLRGAALAAGVVAGGAALGACARGAGNGNSAAPAPTKPKAVLVVTPWGQVGALATTTELLYEAMAPFRAQHPGVDTKVEPALAGADFSAQIIAGTAPDVIHDWTIAQYRDAEYLLPLDSYIHRDNVDLSVFTAPMLAKLRDSAGRTVGLPAILGTPAVAVDLGILDELGLAYPEPDWDHAAFTALAEKVAVHGPKARLGMTLFPAYGTGPGRPASFYFHGFGAAYVDPSDPALCGLTGQGAVDCAAWMAQLLGGGIATISTVEGSLGTKAAMGMVPSWSLVTQAVNFRSLKWQYWNMPTWPARPATFSTSNYWAIPSTCKQQDLAWELLKWLATSADWVRSNIKLFLMSPALKSMWSEWLTTVAAIAPPLANKNLAAFSQLALTNNAYPADLFAYADASAFQDVINGPYGLLSAVVPKKVTPQAALPQIVRQVNAVEAAAQQTSARSSQLVKQLQAAGPSTAFPKPSRTGAGTPPVPAGPSVKVASGTGVYTLLGTGGDVWAGSDHCAFAGAPWTLGGGEFTCRVATLAAVTGGLHGYAKAGLMARADLSGDAPLAALEVTGQNGIYAQNLFAVDGQAQSWGAGGRTAPSKGGFIDGATLTLPASKNTANYLTQPVWLKLTRQGMQWTAWTSTDGTKWAQAGSPIPALMGGCWVGVFVSSQSAGASVRATFDHLSLKPTTFVRIGS